MHFTDRNGISKALYQRNLSDKFDEKIIIIIIIVIIIIIIIIIITVIGIIIS